MQFNWNQVAKPPAGDQVEVTVIGPGFGECVIAHTGEGQWLIVDSCRDPESGKAAPLLYLQALGIDPAASVKWVVSTHWHADHVAGISDVVSACSNAEFFCAAQLQQREFLEYAALSGVIRSTDKAKEFREIVMLMKASQRQVKWIISGRGIVAAAGTPQRPPFSIQALSPSDKEHSLFLERIVSQMPKRGKPHRALIASDPNHAAIVLWLRWGNESVLLGADLLTDTRDDRGWLAAIEQAEILGLSQASLVKIPHHGSAGGHCPQMWTTLLLPKPLSAITPYSRGRKEGRPPKPTDLARISKLSSHTVLTAPTQSGRARKKGSPIAMGLAQNGIKMRTLNADIGIARFRRPHGGPWSIETFGRAKVV